MRREIEIRREKFWCFSMLVTSVGVSVAQIIAAFVGFVMCLWLGLPLGRADQSSMSFNTAAQQSGMVTAVHEQTVMIDGREYGFSPKVVVLDHEGRKVELAYITRNSEVRFSLVKDETHKIDKIVVRHPE